MSEIKKKTYKVTARQMGDLLDEFNALKSMVVSLQKHGDCTIRDLTEAGYLIPHLAEVFNFRPQADSDSEDGYDMSEDFVLPSDPRAFPLEDDDNDENETNGDLH